MNGHDPITSCSALQTLAGALYLAAVLFGLVLIII